MATDQDLQVQEKQEVEAQAEQTVPLKTFVPATDISESAEDLRVVMEMPGVKREDVGVGIENDVLNVEGRIDFKNYEGLSPIYTEYNIGNFRRSFKLSSKVDQARISAKVEDGVLTLVLPKAEEAKPRRIEIG